MNSPAHRIGTLTMVEVGSTCVWSSTRRGGPSHDEPIGGVVMSIDDQVNTETGEIERWFVTLDPYATARKIVVHRVGEAEVGQDGIEAADPARLTRLIRRLAKEVAEGKGSFLSTHDARYLAWAQSMAAVLYGRIGLTPAGGR